MATSTLVEKAKEVNSRVAVIATILFCFEHLKDRGDLNHGCDSLQNAALIMHDDDSFIDELLDFVNEYIEDFGVYYDL